MALIIIAGSETNATLLVSIASILAEHPEAQRKVSEEIRSLFKNEDEITSSSVNQLTYLRACINETMRLFPPAAIGGPRVVPRGGAMIAGDFVPENVRRPPFNLSQIGEELTPKQTIVAVAQWAAYHSTDHFTKPLEFHPERWLRQAPFEDDNLEMFQPFGVGHRDCIARK